MRIPTGWTLALWAPLLGLLLLTTACRSRCVPPTPERLAVGDPDAEAAPVSEAATNSEAAPAERTRAIRHFQDAFLAELLRGIDDPDTVVDWAYISAYIELKDRGGFRDGGRGFSQYGPMLSDEELQELGGRLHAALPKKRGKALVAAVETAARLQADTGPEFRDAAIRAWPDADANMRMWLLSETWEVLRDPRMVPLLVPEIEVARERPTPWHVDDVRSLALQRYVDLEPEKGRALVLADIARKAPSFGGVALTSLPDEHLEEVDANFRRPLDELTHWSFDMEKHGPLAERYGGDTALDTARAILDKPAHIWNTHLLRVVMSRDRADAFKRMAKAIATRHPEHEYLHRLVLTRVLASNWIALPDYWGPDAAAFVRGCLDDSDPRVAKDAAELLAAHAPPEDAAEAR